MQTSEYRLTHCPTVTSDRRRLLALLVAHPEYGRRYDQDDNEENGPGIYAAIGFHCFDRVAHCIASFRFYR
jgi:hypothetical protein